MTTQKITTKLLKQKNYSNGKTFLQYCAYCGKTKEVNEIFQFLRSKGLSVEDEINKYEGRDSLLHLSMLNMRMMTLLLENGADINKELWTFGSLLSIRFTRIILFFMKHGADFHLNYFGPPTGTSYVDIIDRFGKANEISGGYIFDGNYSENDFISFFNLVTKIETIKILCSVTDVVRIKELKIKRFLCKDLIRYLYKFL